jgi:hypothetical protein
MKRSLFVAVAVLVALGACKSGFGDIPTTVPLGVVTVAMGDAPGGTHTTSPAAYFVEAVNVSIPNSATSADTCAQLAFPGQINTAPLTQVDAGTPVVVAAEADTAILTPQAADANGYVFYRLPVGDSILIRPGSVSRVTIPGANNGFGDFNSTFTNADSLKLDPIDATADSTGALTLHWNPQVGPTASVVVQLEFATTSTGLANSQIFCQFTDNGSHDVEPRLANLWRNGSAKHVHAYRFLTTITNDGTNQLDIVSQYSTDSTTIIHP